MTELEDVKNFLSAVHTATVKTLSDTKRLASISGSSKMIIYPPEITGVYENVTQKKFKVTLQESSETNMTTAISNIINGCYDLNRGITISGYTRPTNFLRCRFDSSNQAFEHGTTKVWYHDIYLTCEFTTS